MTKSALVQGAKEKAVKRIMNYSSETTYGPHPPSPDPTAEPEYSPSPEYRAIKASLDAYEMWEAMSNEERLEMILDRYPPFQWIEEQQLPTIALFQHDAIKWGRIRAKGKDCGVDVWDLEKAVDAFLKDQQTTREGQEGQGAAPDSSRSADQSVWAKAITVAEFLQQ